MQGIIQYFTERPFVANVIMFGVILSAVFFWNKIGKEERPEFAMKWVRASISYPGASADDVEKFVIKPIEEQFKGLSGLYEVNTTAAFGSASIRVELDPDIEDISEKYQEIKDAIDRAELPLETEDPAYRRFNSSEKAIVDVGIYLEGIELLDVSAHKNRVQSAEKLKDSVNRNYYPEAQLILG